MRALPNPTKRDCPQIVSPKARESENVSRSSQGLQELAVELSCVCPCYATLSKYLRFPWAGRALTARQALYPKAPVKISTKSRGNVDKIFARDVVLITSTLSGLSGHAKLRGVQDQVAECARFI